MQGDSAHKNFSCRSVFRPSCLELHPQAHTTSMRQMVVSTSLGWETTTSEVANTFTSALSFCSVTDGGLGTWILMVSGRDSGYCWNTCGRHQMCAQGHRKWIFVSQLPNRVGRGEGRFPITGGPHTPGKDMNSLWSGEETACPL